jgi:cation:H+ antiporter
LLLTLAASEAMVRGLTSLGARLGFSEGLLGLLTAVGADAPELSSAVIAIAAGSRDVGVGVVLGSNLFNLAALLGLSALVTGRLSLHRTSLLLDGTIGLVVLALTGWTLSGERPGWRIAAVLVVVFGLYVTVLSLPEASLRRLPGPLARAVVFSPGHLAHDIAAPALGGPKLSIALLPIAVGAVVAGSLGLVHSALQLAQGWHVAPGVTGGLVLAVLTSVPNAYAAVQLGRRGRGTAVMSEAMNSNTINLLGGLVVPAAVLGVSAGAATAGYWWLVGLTLLALGLPLWRQRLGRPGALAVIGGYAAYVAYTLAAPASR